MSVLVYRGAALLMPYHEKEHLFAVMNDPDPAGMCLTVMVSSVKEGRYHDPACFLDDPDHAFVKHKSYLVYRAAETPRVMHLENMINKRYFRPHDDFDPAVYLRIRNGLYASGDIRGNILRYARQKGI